MDKALNKEITLNPDLLVLSAAIRPQADAEEFASSLKLPSDSGKIRHGSPYETASAGSGQ